MGHDETKPSPHYRNSPVQEVICEVHFTVGTPLDEAGVSRLRPVWAEQYPNQRVVKAQHLQLHVGLDGVDAKSTEAGHKLIARSEDGRDLAQLGPRFLAVNRLKPYLGWETCFRDTILARLREVREVHAVAEVERIGLRYINRIDLPESPVKWSDWFAVSLPVPGDFGESGGHFQFRFEKALREDLVGIVQFASVPAPSPEAVSVILDLDVVWRGRVAAEAVPELLEAVHKPHGRMFEGYLMDRTRELFHIPT